MKGVVYRMKMGLAMDVALVANTVWMLDLFVRMAFRFLNDIFIQLLLSS